MFLERMKSAASRTVEEPVPDVSLEQGKEFTATTSPKPLQVSLEDEEQRLGGQRQRDDGLGTLEEVVAYNQEQLGW